MKYRIRNWNEIPDDLPPGKYQTKIVSVTWDEIVLDFVGPYNEDDPCLIPMIKEEWTDEVGFYGR